jgi:hypothetical protein
MLGRPKLTPYARLQPGALYLPPPEKIGRFEFDPDTEWHLGDRWKLYPGAGPPVTVVIQSLAVLQYGGGIGGYGAAIANFEVPDVGNLIAGLRASEYLAAPGRGLEAASGIPFLPVDLLSSAEPGRALDQLLLSRARRIVTGPDWLIEQKAASSPAAKLAYDRVRRMNQLLLDRGPLRQEVRCFRWSPPGQAPLLFLEEVWSASASEPVFNASAVVQQDGDLLTIVSFDDAQARAMRVGLLPERSWKLQEFPAFLNAWRIGNRSFVLTHLGGLGFVVELKEIVSGKGLVPVGLGFNVGD